MKDAPFRLALFGVLITVLRIAMFILVIDSGYGTLFGHIFAGSFAFLVAAGVYISAFAVRFKAARWPGMIGLLLFGAGDLWFNESAVIYNTSSAALVAPESNFLGLGAEYLRYGMQVSALIFGAFPTLAAASLGWTQAAFYKVAELNKPGIFSALSRMVVRWMATFGIQIGNAPQDGGNVPQIVGQISARRWHSLTADEIAIVPQKSRAELTALFGISDGAAGEWKRRVEAGERPWQKGR